MTKRTLVIVGDRIGIDAGSTGPRRDYDELIQRLDADVLHAGALDGPQGRGRGGFALARLAAKRADSYDNVYCDSEHIGLPLSFLLGRKSSRPRLTMIAHYLTPWKKRGLIRGLRLHKRIDQLVVHSAAQSRRAVSLGFTSDQIALVPYQVDACFWRPQSAEATHVASAGQEFRDYLTLMWAVDGIDMQVRIAAGSLWSSREKDFGRTVPRNVQIARLPYEELRAMYASSLFVVVPLHEVDFQAGIITILEAMAMGKAVITSRTTGQRGVVSGPLMVDGRLEETGERAWTEPTGLYVPPGRADALRQAIAYLLAHPDEAKRMGAAGRRHVEASLSIEHFVERMAPIIDPSIMSTMSEGVSA